MPSLSKERDQELMQMPASVTVHSPEIERASLHISVPWHKHLYALPFLSLYPLLAYAYFVKYDQWLVSEEWTFLACVSLGAGARAWITTKKRDADCYSSRSKLHRGQGDIVPVVKKKARTASKITFNYQRDTYSYSPETTTFTRLPLPLHFQTRAQHVFEAKQSWCRHRPRPARALRNNEFDIPIPSFTELFSEHATAPFFVFQIFCVALWCLDEYWYTCTVVWQRVRTLTEFRTMNSLPYAIQCYRDSNGWRSKTDKLLPGDVVSVARRIFLLIMVTTIVNEAMLSGESTPYEVASPIKRQMAVAWASFFRTGFGTAQGQLVRTMIFSTERVSANNFESFLFIGFLPSLLSPPVASCLLDCVLIITSVVPPELPMELSLAVNASLVALSKFAIFCTEPFRIPFAGRVDVCCLTRLEPSRRENLVLEGVVVPLNPRKLVDPLVQLDDGTIVGDPMEKTTPRLSGMDNRQSDFLAPTKPDYAPHKNIITIKRRFQFSSALKRMSTISALPNGGLVVAVKGAPDDDQRNINKLPGLDVESSLRFAGFLVFHCPLKADAIESLKMLADSSHTNNPLTAIHVARDVEIVDRDVLILDMAEEPKHDRDLVWRTVDESKIIPVDPTQLLDTSLFKDYDICVTGPALKHFEHQTEALNAIVSHAWVYARVSPIQKEIILTTLKTLGYTTLMAGDGTNDVGALKQAYWCCASRWYSRGPAKIAERQRLERIKKVYESQLSIAARFNQPPPPVQLPLRISSQMPSRLRRRLRRNLGAARKKTPWRSVAHDWIKMADMEGDDEVPKIKLGDASCAAPFTSKLGHVAAITHIIRQGRCTLVATIQMYKILALNCLITAYSLSVQYLDGIKFGDYQVTISGMLMSICFLCISRAKPVDKLSKERPLGNIFNFYVLLSVLLQFALHIVTLVYITNLSHHFEPELAQHCHYLLGLSQQVSTFAINFQGRPFREGISENRALWWGLVGASAVAFSGATDFMPELNRWLQIVEMTDYFKIRLTASMIIDFAGCYIIEQVCKALFADLEPKELRAVEALEAAKEALKQIEERKQQ
ncbi:cation-transporting ATPase [Coprinopsis sp. MPI-PUGE-AT-0042]|nr:cation-transporting ATPase [Coprinopsis sp. MPI-PUGE-AT-0042]